VAAIEVNSFVSGFSNAVEFTTSKVAALHMEDTAPATSLMTGVPVRSMFQIDALALKTTLWASWGMRAANHVAWIQSATW
jgi:hypothetical protein